MTTDTQPAGTTTTTTGAQPAADTTTTTTPVVAATTAATTATEPTAVVDASKTPPADPSATTTAATDTTKTDEGKGAPEQYADFTVPDEGVLNPEVAAAFRATAKELNLSQEEAQALISKVQPAMAKQATEARASALNAMSDGFVRSIASDKEIGGTKDMVDANVAIARSALDKFGTPALRALLDESRLGNHPEIVRWALRVGKAMNADSTFVSGAAPGQHDTSDAGKQSRLYPSTTKAAA